MNREMKIIEAISNDQHLRLLNRKRQRCFELLVPTYILKDDVMEVYQEENKYLKMIDIEIELRIKIIIHSFD